MNTFCLEKEDFPAFSPSLNVLLIFDTHFCNSLAFSTCSFFSSSSDFWQVWVIKKKKRYIPVNDQAINHFSENKDVKIFFSSHTGYWDILFIHLNHIQHITWQMYFQNVYSSKASCDKHSWMINLNSQLVY